MTRSECRAVIDEAEGNDGANNFTRHYATLSFSLALARHLRDARIAEARRLRVVRWNRGRLQPHATVFTRSAAQ